MNDLLSHEQEVKIRACQSATGFAVCSASVVEATEFYARCLVHARTRNRSQHRDLHGAERCPAAAVTLSGVGKVDGNRSRVSEFSGSECAQRSEVSFCSRQPAI